LYRRTKKIQYPPCKKKSPIKPQWPDFENKMEECKWDTTSPLYIKFRKTYRIHPSAIFLMQKMAKKRQGNKPTGTRWGYGDCFLMVSKSLRGHTSEDISEIFGGKNSAVDKAIKIGIATAKDFQYIFSKSFPSEAEAEQIKQRFREENVANPEDLFVGDCVDIPIWTSNDDFYTYKRCCPSRHAIRVSFCGATSKSKTIIATDRDFS
jgi:hypothetical protein